MKNKALGYKLFLLIGENMFFVCKILFFLAIHPGNADEALHLSLITMKDKRPDLYQLEALEALDKDKLKDRKRLKEETRCRCRYSDTKMKMDVTRKMNDVNRRIMNE